MFCSQTDSRTLKNRGYEIHRNSIAVVRLGICTLPAFLDANYQGAGCYDGMVLAAGASCEVQCATGFAADSGNRTYMCDQDGSSFTRAALVCTGPWSAMFARTYHREKSILYHIMQYQIISRCDARRSIRPKGSALPCCLWGLVLICAGRRSTEGLTNEELNENTDCLKHIYD